MIGRCRHLSVACFTRALPVIVCLVVATACDGSKGDDARDAHAPDANGELPPEDITGPTAVIAGPGGAAVNDHLPNIVPPAAAPSDLVPLGEGQAISRTEVSLELVAGATVDDANAVLASVGATIIGTIPDTGVMLIQVATTTVSELMAVLATLNADPSVDMALAELTPGLDALPPANHLPNLWMWALADYAATPPVVAVNGNWGLAMIRAPQLWNLDTYARRQSAAASVSAGVVDNGFDVLHEDLGALSAPGAPTMDHGTFVAGIIGAHWDNRLGIEGINPWISFIEGRLFGDYTRNLRTHYDILRAQTDVKAINNSWGWRYSAYDVADDGVSNNSFDPTRVEFGDFNGDNDHADTFVVGTR
jgi:hypothetical protein